MLTRNRNPDYQSTWENIQNCKNSADELGFRNVLCPFLYKLVKTILIGMAELEFLAAIRCGEVHPNLIRSIANFHMLKITINIISSPGNELDSSERYARSREVIEIISNPIIIRDRKIL